MKPMMVAAVLAVATATGVAAVTVTPAQFDFGKTAVPGGTSLGQFTVSDPQGDTLDLSVTGPNAAEFVLNVAPVASLTFAPGSRVNTAQCLGAGTSPTSCAVALDFKPASLGIRTATLVVANHHGQRATAALRGQGVAPMCELKVVFCNYAHLYTGTFSWTSTLAGPGSQFREQVQVDVIQGVAT